MIRFDGYYRVRIKGDTDLFYAVFMSGAGRSVIGVIRPFSYQLRLFVLIAIFSREVVRIIWSLY